MPRLRTIEHYFADDMVGLLRTGRRRSRWPTRSIALYRDPERRARQAERAGTFLGELRLGAAGRRTGQLLSVNLWRTEGMSKLRFALIGCGSIARKHAHALHHYLEEAEIGAFVDLDICPRAGVLREVRRAGVLPACRR